MTTGGQERGLGWLTRSLGPQERHEEKDGASADLDAPTGVGAPTIRPKKRPLA